MAKIDKETVIQDFMKKLECTREEAEDIVECDWKIDHGERVYFDLSAEQQKVAQKYTRTGTRKTPVVYNFKQRERKPNATKGGIIEELAQFLTEKSDFSVENVEIINKERQIAFIIGEDKFELTLVQKRKPK